jgi:hypothetical protein
MRSEVFIGRGAPICPKCTPLRQMERVANGTFRCRCGETARVKPPKRPLLGDWRRPIARWLRKLADRLDPPQKGPDAAPG